MLSQRPVIPINDTIPVGRQLLEGIRDVSLSIGRGSPASRDINVIIDIKVLEQVLGRLVIDGDIVSVIRQELHSYPGDDVFLEVRPKVIKPRSIIYTDTIANARIHTRVIITIDHDKVISIHGVVVKIKASNNTLAV